jgi:hypothetical protein
MYLMFGDEADKDQTAGKKFFVYGAIFVPTDSIAPLHGDIERARVSTGFVATDSLKSASGSKPRRVTPEQHRALKNDVMKLAHASNVRFCATVDADIKPVAALLDLPLRRVKARLAQRL